MKKPLTPHQIRKMPMLLPLIDSSISRFDRTAIRRFNLFKAMNEEELADVVATAQKHKIPRGQPVFRQGDVARHFYFLLRGRLKVVQLTKDGEQIVVRIVHPGELFGIARALRRTDYPGTAIATVESVALAWNSDLWPGMTARYPALAADALHMVTSHLQEMHARVRELSTENVERRVANTVVRLIARAGRETRDGILIDFPISRQDIAEMTGTTISTVSRILSVWADKGLIKSGRQRIMVIEPQLLIRLTRE